MDNNLIRPSFNQPPAGPQLPRPEEPASKPPEKPKKQKKNRRISIAWLLVVLLLTAGGAGYWWLTQQSKDELSGKNSEIANLESKNKALESELEELKADSADSEDDVLAKARTDIAAAISADKADDLSPHLLDKVMYILAASEGLGTVTKAEAVKQIDGFIDGASGKWNFELPAETLTEYGSGDYAQHFPDGAIVGRSEEGKVISIVLNPAGKASTIFTASNQSVL